MIAIIPARSGSKRIPKKNLVDLGGIPLIAHTMLCAKKSKYLTGNIYVSTEDKEIAKVAKKFGAKVIDRPKELATDSAATLPVLQHAVKTLEERGLEFDTVVLLQATCPFRKVATIDSGIKKLWGNWEKYKAIFSVKSSKFPPYWLLNIENDRLKFILKNDFSKIRSQDFPPTYEIDGVLYVYKKDYLKSSKKYPFAFDKSSYVLTSKLESIDIDDHQDLEIARALSKSIKV